MLRNSADMSVELGVELYIWLKKRPRLGWFTLQGPQFTERRSVLAITQAIKPALNHAKLRESQ